MSNERIRQLIAEHGRLGIEINALKNSDDLYRAGLTSHASVNLMLALEDEFDIEFPEQYLNRGTFESVDSIRKALAEITGDMSLAN